MHKHVSSRRRQLVVGAAVAALVGAGVGVATAGGGQVDSVTGVAAYERAGVASDALPQTEVAGRAADALGLSVGSSRAIASGPGGRRVVVAPVTSGGACLLVVGSDDGNVPAVCSHGTSGIFEPGDAAMAVVVRSEGDPSAPDLVEVAGAVRSGASVAAIRIDAGGTSRTVTPTADGGFLVELGRSDLAGAVGVDAVVALDAAGAEVARYEPAA